MAHELELVECSDSLLSKVLIEIMNALSPIAMKTDDPISTVITILSNIQCSFMLAIGPHLKNYKTFTDVIPMLNAEFNTKTETLTFNNNVWGLLQELSPINKPKHMQHHFQTLYTAFYYQINNPTDIQSDKSPLWNIMIQSFILLQFITPIDNVNIPISDGVAVLQPTHIILTGQLSYYEIILLLQEGFKVIYNIDTDIPSIYIPKYEDERSLNELSLFSGPQEEIVHRVQACHRLNLTTVQSTISPISTLVNVIVIGSPNLFLEFHQAATSHALTKPFHSTHMQTLDKLLETRYEPFMSYKDGINGMNTDILTMFNTDHLPKPQTPTPTEEPPSDIPIPSPNNTTPKSSVSKSRSPRKKKGKQ